MKKIILLLLFYSTCINTASPEQPKILSLMHVKDQSSSLSASFLHTLCTLFKAHTFVETGTFVGQSTANALPFFTEVHTIELSPKYYAIAQERFAQNSHVHVHFGDSTQILPTLLPTLTGKIIFWLDGHYSTGNTAQGSLNTPIVQELLAIKDSGIQDAIILIDDIRCFAKFANIPANEELQGYPTVKELQSLILLINPTYQMYIYGDIAIAFLESENVSVSSVIKACTLSRLYETEEDNFDEVIEAEKHIALAQGTEKEVLYRLPITYSHPPSMHKMGSHYYLWQGLIAMHNKQYNDAQKKFLEVIRCSNFNEQHAHYYLQQLTQ